VIYLGRSAFCPPISRIIPSFYMQALHQRAMRRFVFRRFAIVFFASIVNAFAIVFVRTAKFTIDAFALAVSIPAKVVYGTLQRILIRGV
jgi:hypothetical protein